MRFVCMRVIVVLSLCANVFVSKVSSFFLFLLPRVLKNTFYVCGGAFLVFDQKFVQAPSFSSDHATSSLVCLVRYVVYTTFVFSFRSSRRRQQRDDLFSRSSRLALLRSAQNVSSFSRGKRWKDYILFLRAKKRRRRRPSSSVVLCHCCCCCCRVISSFL